MYSELSLTVRVVMMFHSTRCSFLCWKSSGSHFLIIFFFGIANCHSILRIKDCGITCSQGVLCKNKPTYDMWNLFCRTTPKPLTSKILENMKISTVMKCPQSGQCSLHLNIIGTVNLDDYIRGVEICTMSMSSQQNQCMYIKFTKIKGKKYGPKVHVQANCFEVGVSEHVFVTMKTVPDYCGIETSKDYHVQDCHNKDLGKHLLPCLTGKLDYMVNEEKKYIVVFVSNIPEDFDYNVRLCVKNISCHDTGAHALIEKDDSTKSVTLRYSEIVPCLCIEGWLQFPDSRRTRLCPFKNDLDYLWDHITYNPRTHDLAWKSACPVDATVDLCRIKGKKCVNIPDSRSAKKDQALYYQVDTQPKLCMKFTTEKGAWVRCPFVSGAFPAWKMKTVFTDEVIQIKFMSSAKAEFSVFICNRTKHNSCGSIQRHGLVYVGASGYVSLNVTRDLCGPNICIQGLRVDVNYSLPVQICNIPCTFQQKKMPKKNVLKSRMKNFPEIEFNQKKMKKKSLLNSKIRYHTEIEQHGNLL